MILKSLLTITLSVGMIILAASFLARADQNKRCPQKVAGPLRFIYLCPEVKTTVKPRVANSRFSAHFEPGAVSDATGCKITTWVITYNKQGSKTGESSRAGKDCTDAIKQLPNPTLTVEQTMPTDAYYARARGCVDLYFLGSSHSGWQRCGESQKVGFNRN